MKKQGKKQVQRNKGEKASGKKKLLVPEVIPGRPTKFDAEVAGRILSGLASGDTLTHLCSADGMPCRQTVSNWVLEGITGEDPKKLQFAVKFRLACDIRAALVEDSFLDDIRLVREMPIEDLLKQVVRYEILFNEQKWFLCKFRKRESDVDGLDDAIKKIAQAAGVGSSSSEFSEESPRLRALRQKIEGEADE